MIYKCGSGRPISIRMIASQVASRMIHPSRPKSTRMMTPLGSFFWMDADFSLSDRPTPAMCRMMPGWWPYASCRTG